MRSTMTTVNPNDPPVTPHMRPFRDWICRREYRTWAAAGYYSRNVGLLLVYMDDPTRLNDSAALGVAYGRLKEERGPVRAGQARTGWRMFQRWACEEEGVQIAPLQGLCEVQ